MHAIKLASHLLTLLSLAAIAVPAYHLNRHAWLSTRLRTARVQYPDVLDRRRHELARKLMELRDQWQPWKAWCLHIGTVSGAGAAALSLMGDLIR